MAMTAKELKEMTLDAVAKGVKNRAAFREAIPLLVVLQERIKKIAASLGEMKKLQASLNESVCDYADENSSAFDSIREVKDESDVSLIVIDGVQYAYKRGWNGIERASGSNKTGDFLAKLPKEWVRTKLELDISEICRLDVKDEVLLKHDLTWCAKRTWEKNEE